MNNEILIRLGVNGQAQVVAAFNQLVAGAGKLSAALAGLAGVAGVGALAKQAINTADEMGKLSQKTGILVESLSGLSYAAKLGDLEQQEFANALKFLQKEMVATGRESEGVEARLLDLADVFQRMPDGPEKTALAMKNFGREGVNMIPLLNQGAEAIKKQREEAVALGLVIDREFAENADAFNDNLDRIKAALDGVFLKIARDVLPSLVTLSEWFVAFVKEAPAVQTAIGFITTELRLLGETLDILTNKQRSLLQLLNPSYWVAGKMFSEALIESFKPVSKALTDALTVKRSVVELATREATLLANIKATRAQLSEIEARSDLSRQDRLRLRLMWMTQERTAINNLIKDLGPAPSASTFQNSQGQNVRSEESIKYHEKLNALIEKRAAVERQIHDLHADETFSGRMLANIQQLDEAWGNIGRNAADVFAGTIQTAVNGVSDAIYGLITGTATWGEVFANVARQIIKNIISMVVQWIASMTIMAALRKVFNLSGATEASTLAAAWAPAAVAASIASYGTAAAVGGAAYTAALLAGTATTTGLSAAGYAQGGYTGNGPRYEIAGPVHRGEFIFSAPETQRIGVDNLEAIASGAMVGGASAVNVAPQNVSVGLLNTDAQKRAWLKSDPGVRKIIIDLINGSKFELGMA